MTVFARICGANVFRGLLSSTNRLNRTGRDDGNDNDTLPDEKGRIPTRRELIAFKFLLLLFFLVEALVNRHESLPVRSYCESLIQNPPRITVLTL